MKPIDSLSLEDIELLLELIEDPANHPGLDGPYKAIILHLDGKHQREFRDLNHIYEWLAYGTSHYLKERVRERNAAAD